MHCEGFVVLYDDGRVAAILGEEPGGPRITCDGCGLVLNIRQDRPPPAWFLDGKAAPGWKRTRRDDTLDDRFPRCKVKP